MSISPDIWSAAPRLALGTERGRRGSTWLSAGASPSISIEALLQSILSPNGEDYAFFDFIDTSRMWKNPYGNGGVSVAGDTIGSIVDKQNGALVGPEQVVDGSFSGGSVDAGWGASGSAVLALSGGGLQITNGASAECAAQWTLPNTNTGPGTLYRLRVSQLSFGGGSGQLAIQLSNAYFLGGTSIRNSLSSLGGNQVDILFVSNSGSTPAVLFRPNSGTLGAYIVIDDVSIVKLSGSKYNATQGTGTLRPAYQSGGGVKTDGTDDVMLSNWMAGAGGNTMIVQASIPPTVNQNGFIAGLTDASTNARFGLGIATTGKTILGAGDQIPGGTTDFRGQNDVVLGISFAKGISFAAFEPGGQFAYTVPTTDPITTIPMAMGERNVGGTLGVPFGGIIKRVAVSKSLITYAQYQQIQASWLAS